MYPQQGLIKLLIEMLYVDDERDAKIISYYYERALLTLIVENDEVANDIYRMYRNVRLLPIKNVARRAHNQVDHTPEGQTILTQHKSGSDRWMTECAVVNIVKFHDIEHESLRATVAWTLLRGACIVNTWEEATKKMRESKHFCPDMIERSEGRYILAALKCCECSLSC